MEVRSGGAWRDITAAEAYIGGSWRTLKYAEAYIGGAWRQIATFTSNLSVSLNFSVRSISGAESTITGAPVTATPTGGLGPFSYSWAKLSGDSITINSPANATTAFTAAGMATEEGRSATFRCTCTDSLGATATADCSITLTRAEFTGGESS